MELISKQNAIDLIQCAKAIDNDDLRDVLRAVCKYHELAVGTKGIVLSRCNYHGKPIPKNSIWADCDAECPFLKMLKLEKLEGADGEEE